MKVTFDIDCTPQEARQFLGLPDVGPMQQEMMKTLHEKMRESLNVMDPSEAMSAWMPLMTQGAQQFQDMFSGMMTGTSRKASKK